MIAKKYRVIKDKYRRILFHKYERKKRLLKYLLFSTRNTTDKVLIHSKLQRFSRNSSISRIKNMDIITGSAKSIYRKFGLSRHSFRYLANNGYLVGIRKSSW
jgi:ribosomal protein S14